MIKSNIIKKGLVIKVRRYKKRIPQHWHERSERKSFMNRIVTITSEPKPIPVDYKKAREIIIYEFFIKESTFPWYSDDCVRVNKIQ